MATNGEKPGNKITWTNDTGSAVVSGQVVRMGNTLGVAQGDIANGATGEVGVHFSYRVPKVSAAVIKAGESLTWDASAAAFDDNAATPADGDVTGASARADEAGINTQTTLLVHFTGVPGTVT